MACMRKRRSTRIETIPEAMSGYADSTLLTMLQVAAYTAPGTFEQGVALTTQEETPSFAFYPDMPGNITLARQWSTETGLLTDTFLKLSPDRHFHTAFVGDTGFGKSIAAERLAYETTRFWHYRTIVLDFGQGWRKALNWPGIGANGSEDGQSHVDIRQLYPGSPRPLRWNILQVPRRIEPGRYRSMIAELFANAGRMGARQLGFMRRALTELYLEAGVLTGDPKLQNGPLGHLAKMRTKCGLFGMSVKTLRDFQTRCIPVRFWVALSGIAGAGGVSQQTTGRLQMGGPAADL